MMGRDRAAYMRQYRARKKRIRELAALGDEQSDEVLTKVFDMSNTRGRIDAAFTIVKADIRIAELEEEVRYLKTELAKRATPAIRPFNSRPFTPVPKK